MRGYPQDALSAYKFLDAPLGGTKLLVGNAELRAPLFWRLSGVLFADAGNTFANDQAIRLSELGVGLGFGLRINTPLMDLTKAQIIARGLALGVDYGRTRSCYDPTPEGLACGECDSCQLRRKGFAANGIADPAPYR